MPLPEQIDYRVASNDPADVIDECIYEGDDGPHSHKKKLKKSRRSDEARQGR